MEILKSNYRVTINQNWRKERFTLRTSSRNIFCHECHEKIEKNSMYIRDKFWYYGSFFGMTKKKTNFICLKCWKGEIPINITKNWMDKPNAN